jgi:hypothetical protein
MASENRDWGYDRIAGALANLGYEISDQTVGNVLQRHGLPPAPERKRTPTWAAFIRTHLALLAGTDFFTAEVLTLRGLVTYYVLFFIHLEPPTATDAHARDPPPSAPRGHGPQAKTCSLSCSSWLHLLKSWSLRQTRGGSPKAFAMPLDHVAGLTSTMMCKACGQIR